MVFSKVHTTNRLIMVFFWLKNSGCVPWLAISKYWIRITVYGLPRLKWWNLSFYIIVYKAGRSARHCTVSCNWESHSENNNCGTYILEKNKTFVYVFISKHFFTSHQKSDLHNKMCCLLPSCMPLSIRWREILLQCSAVT